MSSCICGDEADEIGRVAFVSGVNADPGAAGGGGVGEFVDGGAGGERFVGLKGEECIFGGAGGGAGAGELRLGLGLADDGDGEGHEEDGGDDGAPEGVHDHEPTSA